MASFVDKRQEVLTVVSRVSDLEKRHSSTARATKDELRLIMTDVGGLDRRLGILETRFDGLARQTATEARAAAQSAASLVVAGELRAIGERIARLEGAKGGSSHRRALPLPG